MIIRARAPLRIGLACGGTDVSPFCDLHGGYVLNATIDRYAYATLRPIESTTAFFISSDRGSSDALELIDGEPLPLNRVDCGLQGNRQDQYSATIGGFNFIEFSDADKAVVNSLGLKNWIASELGASLLLFFTGVSRESAKIIADQSAGVKDLNPEALVSMHQMKQEALQMKEYLLKGDFKGIVESMRLEWQAKKTSAKTVSNPMIDSIYNAAIKAAALSGKISGAGGGGFMMFFVPPEKRMSVIEALDNFSGQVGNCHFTDNGAQAWSVA